jgi:hypothetical protein
MTEPTTNQEVAQHLIETAEDRVVTEAYLDGVYHKDASIWRCLDCGNRMVGRRYWGNPGVVMLHYCPTCDKQSQTVHAPAPEGYLLVGVDQ